MGLILLIILVILLFGGGWGPRSAAGAAPDTDITAMAASGWARFC